MSLPEITMTGNVCADPELRFVPSGAAVTQFRIACTERVLDRNTNEWRDGDKCFLTVEVWRQQAENIAESLKQGMTVTVIGKLRQRQYETAAGEKRTAFEVKDAQVSIGLTNQTVGNVEKNGRTAATAPAAPAAAPAASAPAAAAAPAVAGVGAGFLDAPPF